MCQVDKVESKQEETTTMLYKCEPEAWLNAYPKWQRFAIGYFTMFLFAFSFLLIPFCITLCGIAYFYGYYNVIMGVILFLSTSFILPANEWKGFRKMGQFWYDLVDFSCSLSPEERKKYVFDADTKQFILAMHPHGVVPFQGVLYAAYCDQFLSFRGKTAYGFGAAANVVLFLPYLRNIMGWLSVSGADHSTLKEKLTNYSLYSSRQHTNTKSLFLLPGGIAEIYTSRPKTHVVVFKKRKGLVRLALETGAELVPVYVFGATDFYDSIAAGENIIARLARKLRMGINLFYGPYFLPIPYLPRVTFAYAAPISVQKWDSSKGSIPAALIDEIHAKYMKSLTEAFEKYKVAAGYPDAKLEII